MPKATLFQAKNVKDINLAIANSADMMQKRALL